MGQDEEFSTTTNGRLKIPFGAAIQICIILFGVAVACGALQWRVGAVEKRMDAAEATHTAEQGILSDIKERVIRIEASQTAQRREDREARGMRR